MYPFPLQRDRLLASLAASRGEPSVQDLLNDESKSDLQHAADWQQVITYLDTVTVSSLEVHVPLLQATPGVQQFGQVPTGEQHPLGLPPSFV